ncbi:MAG: hypothetical protein GF308_10740 [Candidatus Heimdallarchaeota archaeon]|nr:hypothetical protein [Candidatus Heimdallarchaeota archaeon]
MEIIIIIGLILLAIGSYLLGSVCWAIIIGKFAIKEDIRTLGDRNPGAYNVGKSLGAKRGLLVMFSDSLKGMIPAIIATTINFKEYQKWAIGLAGTMAVLGHCYPIFFGFKGGNGYSTIFGFMLFYNPSMVLEWGILVFVLTLIFQYIRPMQMIAITITGITGFFIKWPFYWWNIMPRLSTEIAMNTIPILVLVIAVIQLPRFIPYFIGMVKGTEEKINFFAIFGGGNNKETKKNGQVLINSHEK